MAGGGGPALKRGGAPRLNVCAENTGHSLDCPFSLSAQSVQSCVVALDGGQWTVFGLCIQVRDTTN